MPVAASPTWQTTVGTLGAGYADRYIYLRVHARHYLGPAGYVIDMYIYLGPARYVGICTLV